jgi:hypothetical protein
MTFCCIDTFAQYEKLVQLSGYKTSVYFSAGAESKAKRMAEQLDNVIGFYQERIHFSPSVTLLILSPGDWSTFTKYPVYGMPHYFRQVLIVAAEDNDFWKSFVPPLDKLPGEYAEMVSRTYADGKAGLSMEPFFDLLAIHELGHAYHLQGDLVMQRNWMGELFCNILLHTYIAEKEPQLIPALTTFPKMVVATTNNTNLKYTTLAELEAHYAETAEKYPQNYGWYQCRWHMAAGTIYDKGGLAAFTRLWSALKTHRVKLDDQALDAMLRKDAHQSVADVQAMWAQQ